MTDLASLAALDAEIRDALYALGIEDEFIVPAANV